MRKIREYYVYFGGTHVECYYDLVDMGEIRESEYLLEKCKRLDKQIAA